MIPRVDPEAYLLAYSAEAGTAVFAKANRTGSFLTLEQDGQSQSLIATNTFLREVAEGEERVISYRGLDGQALNGRLLLPANYQSGKRYPLVMHVYPGDEVGPGDGGSDGLNTEGPHFLSRQLLAARGYAVFHPSMPESKGYDPYMELTKGVLPAIDKLIDLGIADSDRVAVMGHSYGGFGTLGLLTQTNRFKAAIASAGPVDRISEYGTMGNRRYSPFAHSYSQSPSESDQGSMGNPPWKDWTRYLRNSPLFYVDRIETPVMTVYGEQDGAVPIEQGEELYSALRRLGKRSQFLRYWGEGHGLSSPANILDFWSRAYPWLDEFCDVTRDEQGDLVFDGEKVKSRNGAPVQFTSEAWLKMWDQQRPALQSATP